MFVIFINFFVNISTKKWLLNVKQSTCYQTTKYRTIFQMRLNGKKNTKIVLTSAAYYRNLKYKYDCPFYLSIERYFEIKYLAYYFPE